MERKKQTKERKEPAVLTGQVQKLEKKKKKTLGESERKSGCHSQNRERERCRCLDGKGSPGASVTVQAPVTAITCRNRIFICFCIRSK